jgi:hypothetical protein
MLREIIYGSTPQNKVRKWEMRHAAEQGEEVGDEADGMQCVEAAGAGRAVREIGAGTDE